MRLRASPAPTILKWPGLSRAFLWVDPGGMIESVSNTRGKPYITQLLCRTLVASGDNLLDYYGKWRCADGGGQRVRRTKYVFKHGMFLSTHCYLSRSMRP